MTDRKLYGVGGWLALLVVGLMFLGPLVSIGSTISELRQTEADFPQLMGTDLWSNIKLVSWASVAISVAITVFAGFRLTNEFAPRSAYIAIGALWLVGLVIPLLSVWLIALVSGSGVNSAANEVATMIFRGAISALIWTAYLLRSRRVKNTYFSVTQSSEVVAAGS